ncbi:TlpA family protein disulfide reductase [Echinicola soli]|uniref:TlpA family protein disulfide reductase n=1 Tax=Echinicola soli TaxID=2591634 RepID=A0A514CKJ7_9BACT|nr:TlpA disulfide reductase family protein [Echinicola soli]QDH80365.1 TlpA family protein disulfide reductase [Echinicola soli]
MKRLFWLALSVSLLLLSISKAPCSPFQELSQKEEIPVNVRTPAVDQQPFRGDTARLEGYIKDYEPSMGFKTGIIQAEDVLSNKSYPVVIKVFPDGKFEAKWPILYPIYTSVKIGDQWMSVYVEPGKTLTMELDRRDFIEAGKKNDHRYKFQHTEFHGPLAKINRELMDFDFEHFNYRTMESQATSLTPTEFKEKQMAVLQTQQENANSYIEENTVDPKAASIINNNILLENARVLFNFENKRQYLTKHDTSKAVFDNIVLKQPVPEGYYDFLKELPLDDKSLMVADEYNLFINRFEFSKPFTRSSPTYKIPVKKIDLAVILGYFDQEEIEIPDQMRRLMELSYKENKTKEDSTFIEESESDINFFMAKHSAGLQGYLKEFIESQQPSKLTYYKKYWHNRDSVLINQFGLRDSWTYQVTKLRSLAFTLNFIGPEGAAEYWEELKSDLTYDELRWKGQEIYDQVVADRVSIAYSLGKGEAAEIFKEIIAPYKGKILFVDFWATSCGPCVYTIEKMKPIRQKFIDNEDVEFIFITERSSSPEKKYLEFTAEQELTHTYMISEDDLNQLRQLFEFNSIPRYVVIDREGKVYDDNFPMHNFTSRLQDILAANP